ncbi:ABC transporter substrate-binding protein [Adlercreutzia sp. R25]|uniref:ABC transporter substrate-binding protein n=1 Tax=Adlercreutzia shanghongiae TaxID=3111773 RepID=UPI002DB5E5E7|nr:ABC transporter substrate-binding protein [Adlercreutzia sp. R25]MEC4271901.1 ABC transporter substrate-binding protein [Adlercreutzia sp. R25]
MRTTLRRGSAPTPRFRLGKAAVCAALSLTLCLCGCGGPATNSADGTDGATTAKMLHAGSATYFYAMSLDPASDWDSWYLQYYGIVENLFRVSDDLTAEPWLAASAENVDEHTWKITLRDDVKFSNGEPLDASAVKGCWERTYETNPRAAETLALSRIEADGLELTLTTENPVPALENILCDPLLCVYYVGDGIDYAAGTPATGPYRAVDFVAEDHVDLAPNEHYWNGTPKLNAIRLTSFADDTATALALQNGEIQAVAMPDASVLAALQGDERFKVEQKTSSRADFIRFNMDHDLISHAAIRAAIASCIDRDGYASVICGGSQVPSWGVYSATLPFGGTEGLKVAIDQCSIENASRLLDAAGITDSDGDGVREADGQPVELTLYVCTRYGRFVSLADDLQSRLSQVGIKLSLVPTDYFLEDAETFARDNPDMTLDSYAMAPTGNQGYFAAMSFATGASNNFGHYSNRDVDTLVAQLSDTYGEDERDEIARQIAQIVLDDLPYVFFSNSQTTIISTVGVTGLAVAPSEYYFITADTDIA